MAVSPRFLDELRTRLSLESVVGKRVRLQRRGRELTGLCPFHKEKTPSFTVSDQKGFFHCFSCGAHGDVIGFVMRDEGLSFPEAIERLAGEAGLEIPREAPLERAKRESELSLYGVLEEATRWFEGQLKGESGRAARIYLTGRGLSGETVSAFRLGFAPDSRDGLKAALGSQGIAEALMVEAGLIIVPEGGGQSYDRFRGRIIFPIRDGRARVIAFGGRAMGTAEPKYLNSPETPVFHKGSILYGLERAGPAARKTGRLIAVEGYMDVIALHQAGIVETVAPLGTALTEMQIETLWRYAAEPILCFDGDAAGGRAAARAAERALPRLHSGFSLRFATLPAGEDPDSLIVHQGKPALDAVLAAAEPLSAVLWRIASGTTGLDTPEGRAAVNRRLQGYLEQIAERDLRFYYQQHYRERLTARPRQRPLRGRQPPPTFRSGAAMQTFQEDRLPALHTLPSQTDSAAGPRARTILQTLYNFPLLLGEFAEELAEIEFASGPHRAVRDFLIAAVRGGALDHGDLEARLRDAGLDQVAAELIGDRARYLDWAARAGPAALDEARIQLRQVIDLYRRLRDLENFRREAEAALAREASQENLDRLIGALEAINAAPGTEVALPGYADQPRNSRVED